MNSNFIYDSIEISYKRRQYSLAHLFTYYIDISKQTLLFETWKLSHQESGRKLILTHCFRQFNYIAVICNCFAKIAPCQTIQKQVFKRQGRHCTTVGENQKRSAGRYPSIPLSTAYISDTASRNMTCYRPSDQAIVWSNPQDKIQITSRAARLLLEPSTSIP